MIGSVFIKCNAASPNIPLKPLFTFKGSPSSLRVIDVPRKIGTWQITAVHVSATYPDNRAVTKSAVLTGGAWVATLDAPDATGEVAGGFVVTADGTDEQGNAVKGYVLGVGDLRVLDRDLSISVGGEVYYLHFFDEQPDAPHKGDMCVIGGALKWWNGEAWELFGAGGDMSHSEFAGLPEADLNADEVGFPEICEMINKMKNALRPAALVAALCLAAFGASAAPSVEKSKLSALKGASNVVTAVSFDGLATKDDLAKATPGDYANVSNKAYSAATQTALSEETARAQAAEAKNADAITAETTRAKAAEQANADAIAKKADASALDDYATKDSLSSLAPLSALASHTNDTANPHKVTAAQVGAYTKAEIDAKGYLTEHQSLDGYAKSANLAKVATSGKYADLTGKPTIPSKTSELTNDAGYLTSFTETDPTVPSWAKATTKPTYTASEVGAVPTTRKVNSKALSANINLGASDVGAYSSSDGAALAKRVTQAENDVGVLTAYVSGTDAALTITNYNSSTEMPSAELAVKMEDEATESNVLSTVWRELTRWSRFLGVADVPLLDWGFSGVTNFQGFVDAAIDEIDAKSPKEYAFFDGVTGNPSPDGVFQISMPRVLICAGAAYQRYGDTAGGYWVLESNGLVADINGTTNGYFRISDEEGNAQFEIVKGDKQTLIATVKTMTNAVMGVTHYFTTYAVTNALATPTAYFSRSLKPAKWIAEGDDCPFNTDWTGPVDNSYTLEWWPKSANEPVVFLKSGYDVGGVTRIVNTAPVQMQTLIVNGTTYTLGTATINGYTVLTLTPATASTTTTD